MRRGAGSGRAHHRVCLVFVGDPCAQQFQIDAKKKNQMKIVRGKMHNGKRSKEIFSNFFRLRLHFCQLARAKGKHYC